MAITLTPLEKAQLQREDSLVLPLPGADGAESAQFHNPETGQEFFGLPVDPRALTRYLRPTNKRCALRMGPASAELKAKWDANESTRQAENDVLMAKYLSVGPDREDHVQREGPGFTEAVADAVAQVLEKLGVEVPNEGQEAHQPQEEATEIEYDSQIPLFAPTDAPSQSDNKRVVSQASRPELRLVEY